MGSLVRVGADLHKMADFLEKLPSRQIITVKEPADQKEAASLQCINLFEGLHEETTWPGRFNFVYKAVSRYLFPQDAPDKETVAYFKKVFGEKRVSRIFVKLEGTENRPVTKRHIEQLFVHASEIYAQDIEELFQEIKSDAQTIRFLDAAETQSLKVRFQEVSTLNECSNKELKILVDHLIPFTSIKDIFLNNVPVLNGARDAGKTFHGMRERVLISETMRRVQTNEITWSMRVAKSLIFREVPEGVVIASPKGGFCKVFELVHGSGAFKTFLLGIGKPNGVRERYVCYRGVHPDFRATGGGKSLLDGFRKDFGSEGPKATFERTHALIKNPANGFVENESDPVVGIGMSLGGAHCMYDAHLLRRVVTIVSPGISRKICEVYADKVNSGGFPYLPIIEHYVEAEDICDQLGEGHLGLGCDPNKVYVQFCVLRPNPDVDDDLPMQEELAKVIAIRKALPDNSGLHNQFEELLGKGDFLFGAEVQKGLVENFKKVVHVKDVVAMLSVLHNVFASVHNRNTLLQPYHALIITSRKHPELLQKVLDHTTSPLIDRRWEAFRSIVSPLIPEG